MDEATLIDYIKKKYRKVIFNPIKLRDVTKGEETTALGFIISDNKLVLGFVNKYGELCKLIDPVDLSKLSHEKFIEIVKRIPTVNGFDSNKLLMLLESTEHVSKTDNKKVLDELNDLISKKNEEISNYNIILNENNKKFLLTKKEYTDSLETIKDNYNKELMSYKQKIQELKDVQNECTNRLINDKEYILQGIKNYKEETNKYINDIIENKGKQVIDLTNMYKKLLSEKTEIEKNLNILLEKEKENLNSNGDIEALAVSEKKVEELNTVINEIKSELNDVKESLSKSEIENKVNQKFTEDCLKKLLEEKDQIIDKIKSYNKEWLNWVNEHFDASLIKSVKDKMKIELSSILDNFKKIVVRKNEYIQSLKISVIEKDNLNKQLKSNISDIKDEINNSIQQQIIELNKKIDKTKEQVKLVDTDKIDLEQNSLKNELVKVKDLLSTQNVIQKINIKDLSPINCKSLYNKFSIMNNSFYRKKEIIKILDTIIISSNFNLANLSYDIKNNIKEKYINIRDNINKHIDFLNLGVISSIKELTPEVCEQLTNNLIYWNANEDVFKKQDEILLNIYSDLTNNIPIFVINNKNYKINNNILSIITSKNNIIYGCESNTKTYPQIGEFDSIMDLNYLSENKTQFESITNQLKNGYSTVIINYGIELEGIKLMLNTLDCNFKIKYMFEQYIKAFSPKSGKINGNIINLINNVPQLNSFSLDETNLFNFEKKTLLKSNDIIELIEYTNSYRKTHKRINKTPNNQESFRSNLYIVLECKFSNEIVSYLSLCLLSLKESPIDIYNTVITKSSSKIEANIKLSSSELLKCIKPEYSDYNISDILKESFYINESINHLVWFLNNRKGVSSNVKFQEISIINPFDNYDSNKFYVDPKDEENTVDSYNNCLTVPIFKFLDILSNKKSAEFKPTKFICLLSINKDLTCNQTIETLEFADKI
jgi:hypothetical protein